MTDRPTALITGASSGIGRELARVFAEHGHDLVITARRRDRLEELAAELGDRVRVEAISANLATRNGIAALKRGITTLKRGITTRELDIDVLVNNAGAGASGEFAGMAPAKSLTLIDLNVRALTDLTHFVLPGMIERGRGRILNVASVASFQAVPGMSVYAASKAFVLSFTEALSEELAATPVTVTALCPGLTRTEMVGDLQAAPDFMFASAAEVAAEGYRACVAGEVIRVPGIANQALVNWLQYQPRWLKRFLSGIAGRAAFAATGGEASPASDISTAA